MERINVGAEDSIVPGAAGEDGAQDLPQPLVHAGAAVQGLGCFQDVGGPVGIEGFHDERPQVRLKALVPKDLTVDFHPGAGAGDGPVEAGVQDVAGHHGQRAPGADEHQMAQPAGGPDRVHVGIRGQAVVRVRTVDVEEHGTRPGGLAWHAWAPWSVAGHPNPIPGPWLTRVDYGGLLRLK